MNTSSYSYVVVHPLDDEPEEKRILSGSFDISRRERILIGIVAVYTVCMLGLVAYSAIHNILMSMH